MSSTINVELTANTAEFKKQLKSVNDAVDSTSGKINKKFKVIGKNMESVGKSLSRLGASILDLGALSSIGLSAETGGAAFSQVMQVMQDAVDKGGEKLKIFSQIAGTDFKEAFEQNSSEAILLFIEGMGRLIEKGEKISPVLEKLGLNSTTVADMMKSAAGASDEFREKLDLSNKSWEENSALTEKAKEGSETFQGVLEIFESSLEDIGIIIRDELKPAMAGIIDIIQNGFLPSIQGLVGGFASLSLEIQKSILAFDGTIFVLEPVLSILASLLSILSVVATAFGVKAVLIGVAIAAIIAGAILLIKHWDAIKDLAQGMKESVISAWDAIKSKIATVWEEIEKSVSDGVNGAIESLKDLAQGMKESVISEWDAIKSKIATVWEEIKKSVSDGVDSAIGSLKDLAQGMKESVISEWDAIKSKIATVWEEIKKSISDGVDSAIGSLKDLADGMKKWVKDKVKDFFEKPIKDAIDAGVGWFESMKNILVANSIIPDMMDLISGEFKDLKSIMVKPTKEATKDVIKEIKGLNKDLADQILAFEVAERFGFSYQNALLAVKSGLDETAIALLEVNEKLKEKKELEEKLAKASKRKNASKDESRNENAPKRENTSRNEKPEKQETTNETKKKEDEKESAKALLKEVLGAIGDTLADAISGIFKGEMKSPGDMLKDFGKGLLDIVSQRTSNAVKGLLDGFIGDKGGFDFSKGIKGIGTFFSQGFGGIKNVVSGIGSLFSGGGILSSLSTIGTGLTSAIPVIGAIASAGMAIFGIVKGLFKKKPKLDVEIGAIKDAQAEAGEVGATIEQILDPAFQDQIVRISKKRKVKGLSSDVIKKSIMDALHGQISVIQESINLLPADVASQLMSSFLSTQIDIEDRIGRDKLLEFDKKGKKIAEEFQKFVNGEVQSRFIFAVRGFFEDALTTLGVDAKKATDMVSSQFEEFLSIDSREGRAEFGQQFLANFQAYIVAFNILNEDAKDLFGSSVSQLKALASELDIAPDSGIPSFERIKESLRSLLEAGELTADVVGKFDLLIQGIVQLRFSIVDAISSTVSLINEIDTATGGITNSSRGTASGLNALRQGINNLKDLISSGVLTPQQNQEALGRMKQLIDQFVNLQSQAQQRVNQSRVKSLQSQISLIQKRKQLEEDSLNAQLKGLQDSLRIAESYKSLNESLESDLRGLFTGSNSILSPIEKLNFIQSEVFSAQQQLQNAMTQEGRLSAIENLRRSSSELIDLGGSSFGTSSSEFQSIFHSVATELQSLLDLTEGEAEKTETLNGQIKAVEERIASIPERFDSTIQRLESTISTLQSASNQTSAKASAEAKAFYDFVRGEAVEILDSHLSNLNEITNDTELTIENGMLELIGNTSGIIDAIDRSNTIQMHGFDKLEHIIATRTKGNHNPLANLAAIFAARGFSGTVTRPTLFVAAENGPEDVEITPTGVGRASESSNLNLNMDIKVIGSNDGKKVGNEIVRTVEQWATTGRGRDIIKEIAN